MNLSIDADQWAAVAAMGSLATALVLHRSSGARPKVKVEIALLDEYSLRRRSPRAKAPPNWSGYGVEAVAVRIENGGRTALTASSPIFDCMDAWWKPERWWRTLRRKRHTVGTVPLPFRGFTTADSVRIEPFDVAEFLLDIGPLFGRQRPRVARRHSWDYVRVRVPIAGRSDVVMSRARIPAGPKVPQLSGEPLDLRTFLIRYFIGKSLQEDLRIEGEPGQRSFPEKESIYLLVEPLLERAERDGRPTRENIDECARDWDPILPNPKIEAISLRSALQEADLLDRDVPSRRVASKDK